MNPPAFGKYQAVKKLATGGMAEVWLAKQTGIEGFKKDVVVKRILPHLADDPEFVQMFLNEAKIAARFNHPNIAQIFDYGRDEATGTYYIAMEFIRGEDLGRVMRKAWSSGQWIARPLAVRIVAACCEGLYYAHNQSDEQGRPLRVVHRDISPQNILISFDGGVKLVDFGIAKASDVASMTKSGAIKGKFAYMSPEQAAGKPLDHRSDIFAIGLVLYELLTGVRPLKRDSELGTLQAALECAIERPSAVADVPNELDDVVMAALTKNFDDRYRDARSFQMALEEFLVSQRWVATSVQISELMETLFADRIAEESKLGHVNPPSLDGQSSSSLPAIPVPPRGNPPSQPVSRTGAPQLGGAAAQPVQEDWGAPPPQPSENDTRPMGAVRRNSREALAAAEQWEAPPGELPRGTSAPRRQSAPNALTPSQQRVAKGNAQRSGNSTLPPLPRHQAEMSDEEAGEMTAMGGEQLAPPPAPPQRTSSSQGVPRKRTSTGTRIPDAGSGEPARRSGQYSLNAAKKQTGEMPEAPPPPRREDRDEDDGRSPQQQRYSQIEEYDAAIARAASKEGRKSLARNLVLVIVFAAVLGGAWLNRQKIVDMMKPRSQYFVSVESNIALTVKLRHRPAEKLPDEVLGQSPLGATAGIHPGDTVILEGRGIGAYAEERIGDELSIGETVKISKEFKKGRLRLHVSPEKRVGSLQVLRDGQQVGTFPGLDIELVEGKHMLELRGNRLKKPAMVEVTVKGNGSVQDSKNFDLTAVVSD